MLTVERFINECFVVTVMNLCDPPFYTQEYLQRKVLSREAFSLFVGRSLVEVVFWTIFAENVKQYV